MALFSSFSYRSPERVERRFRKGQVKALEEVFERDIESIRKLFPLEDIGLRGTVSTELPGKSLCEIGVNALVHTIEISMEQFPLLVRLLSDGRKELRFREFERESGGLIYRTIMTTEDRFSGNTVRLLTNDVELLRAISRMGFGPPPPWIAWYELGPYRAPTQGNFEYWFSYVWGPFWESLSLEEQDKFFEDWRPRTRAYISDEDWEQGWVYLVRMRDPRFRAREQQRDGE